MSVSARACADGKAGKLAKRTLTQRAAEVCRERTPHRDGENKGTAFAIMLNKEHEQNQPRDRIHRITYYVFPGFVEPESTKYVYNLFIRCHKRVYYTMLQNRVYFGRSRMQLFHCQRLSSLRFSLPSGTRARAREWVLRKRMPPLRRPTVISSTCS